MRWHIVAGLFLCAGLSCALAAPSLSLLHSFGFIDSAAYPSAGLLAGSDGALYGTTPAGGTAGQGALFRLNPDGSNFSLLKSFGSTTNDAAMPFASLIEGSDGALYGTTEEGGQFGYGTVFRLNKDGSGFLILKSLTGDDGAYPEAGLLEGSDGLLYGTASGGGTNDYGVLFRLAKDGSGFLPLVKFAGTNGANPEGGLLEAGDGALYGTTCSGGRSSVGTVFSLNRDGSGFTVLWHFAGQSTNGAGPYGRLLEGMDGNLYGTTSAGGTNANGLVYRLAKNGTGFTSLHCFAASSTSDGRLPLAGLFRASDGLFYGTTSGEGGYNNGTLFRLGGDGGGYVVLTNFSLVQGPAGALAEGADGALYGTTERGGDLGGGAVFRVQKNGTGLAVVKSFVLGGGDGASPDAAVTVASDGALYGTTRAGGSLGAGSVFSMRLDGRAYRLVSSLGAGTGFGPVASVIEGLNGLLYGCARSGGTANNGAIFSVQKDGAGLTLLYGFPATSVGQDPRGTLIQGSDGAFYGTTVLGGSSGQGTLFRLNADGSGFATLKNFYPGSSGPGANPVEALLEASDHQLYGTTYSGGAFTNGTIFRLNKDGSGYTVLKSFGNPLTDGANPMSPLLEASDGKLYGTCYGGGSTNNAGAVFRINKDGTGFQVLKAFIGIAGDARHPCGRLVEAGDGALYGTTERGGANDKGALFTLNKDGSGYAVLASFGPATGQCPRGGLLLGSDGALYGTTDQGGAMGFGAVFRYGAPLEEITRFQLSNGRATLTCVGLPGTNYWVERAELLGPAATWVAIGSTNAPADGLFEALDAAPPSAAAFYRLKR